MPHKKLIKTSACVDCGCDVLWGRTAQGKHKGKLYRRMRCTMCRKKNGAKQAARLHTDTVKNKHRKHYTKHCALCGAVFSVVGNPNAGIIKYCGNACRRHASIQEHNNLKYITAMAGERWRGHVKRFERPRIGNKIQLGHATKWAIFISPDGQEYTVANVTHFVRNNGQLFSPADVNWQPKAKIATDEGVNRQSRATGCLVCRAQKALLDVAGGKRGSWKGWVCLASEAMKSNIP